MADMQGGPAAWGFVTPARNVLSKKSGRSLDCRSPVRKSRHLS